MSLASSSKLYQYLQRNPHEESYKQIIQLPEETRLEDWLSVVIIEIFDNLSTVYAQLSHCCNDASCPIMSIGVAHEYLWHEYQDTNSSIKHKRIHCSAPNYINSFIHFVQETISNSSIFPNGNQSHHEYPPRFHSLIQYICKQIFRVFGHLYLHHLASVTSLGLHMTMNTCFKHYLYFVEEFELIKSSELKPLHRFIEISLNRSFGKQFRYKSTADEISAPSHDPNITAFSSIEHSSLNISTLSLPQSIDQHSEPRIIARKSERVPPKSNNVPVDICTEYKYDPSQTSVSIESSMNSITPYPTYADKDGEQTQSKINDTLNNRSVYEYVFNRNEMNASHIALADTNKGERVEDEEKASVDYIMEADTKYSTPTNNVIKNDIDSSKQSKSVLRKCTIIRQINAKETPSANGIEHILNHKQVQRIPLLSTSDLALHSPSKQIMNESEILPTNHHDIVPVSPSFRDVVYYRTKVRSLEKKVKELREENRDLLENLPTKKKKRKKKKRPKTNMAKLVDIMNSMNEQITKLAEAVTDAVTSTDDDDPEKADGDQVHHDINNINSDLAQDENINDVPHLREYLLGKVLNDEQQF